MPSVESSPAGDGYLRVSPGRFAQFAQRAVVLLTVTRKESLPARGCGLKRRARHARPRRRGVTPRAGVWIETGSVGDLDSAAEDVTPRAGVWIETLARPCRRRPCPVTPRAGVWIETAPAG